MKLAINLVLLFSTVSAFTVSGPSSSYKVRTYSTSIANGKNAPEQDPKKKDKEEEKGGLDLDLEEMFDMFDAADKGQKFDDALKKIKK